MESFTACHDTTVRNSLRSLSFFLNSEFPLQGCSRSCSFTNMKRVRVILTFYKLKIFDMKFKLSLQSISNIFMFTSLKVSGYGIFRGLFLLSLLSLHVDNVEFYLYLLCK